MSAPRRLRRDLPVAGARFLHSLVLEAGPDALNRGLDWLAAMTSALALGGDLSGDLCRSFQTVMTGALTPANDSGPLVITLDVKRAETVLTIAAETIGAPAPASFRFAHAA